MKKITISCPCCTKKTRIPDSQKKFNITCPHCEQTFIVEGGLIQLNSSTEQSTHKEDSSDHTSSATLIIFAILALLIGILSAGYSPFLIKKGFWFLSAFLVLLTIAYIILWLIIGLVLAHFEKTLKLANQGIFLLYFSLFVHSCWYTMIDDDLKVAKPLNYVLEMLDIPNEKLDNTKTYLTEARDAMLRKDFESANTSFAKLDKLYTNEPAKFYYFRAYVLQKLEKTDLSNLYAKRYLSRMGEEGKTFKEAHALYLSTKRKNDHVE